MKRVNFSQLTASYNAWDELYEDISTDWQEKAERLQARRWRKLKREMI